MSEVEGGRSGRKWSNTRARACESSYTERMQAVAGHASHNGCELAPQMSVRACIPRTFSLRTRTHSPFRLNGLRVQQICTRTTMLSACLARYAAWGSPLSVWRLPVALPLAQQRQVAGVDVQDGRLLVAFFRQQVNGHLSRSSVLWLLRREEDTGVL